MKSLRFIIIAAIAGIYIIKVNQSDIKLFCAHGQVFIEFTEGFTTWGSVLFDGDGLPVRCDGVDLKTKTMRSKEII